MLRSKKVRGDSKMTGWKNISIWTPQGQLVCTSLQVALRFLVFYKDVPAVGAFTHKFYTGETTDRIKKSYGGANMERTFSITILWGSWVTHRLLIKKCDVMLSVCHALAFQRSSSESSTVKSSTVKVALWSSSVISPRDAMHKRGLCRHAVSVCPSVCHVRGSCQNE